MKTFIDWANTPVWYRFKLIKNMYEQGDKVWSCYCAVGKFANAKEDLEESPDWSSFGTGDTKAIALRSAIQSWNLYDKEGILP
jgi:hypothetical protein